MIATKSDRFYDISPYCSVVCELPTSPHFNTKPILLTLVLLTMILVRKQIRNILAGTGKFTFGRTEIKFKIRATSVPVCVHNFGTLGRC